MRQKPLALVLLVGLLAGALPAAARIKEAPEEYAARRARLIERVGSPVVLFGYGNEVSNVSLLYTFRQEESFYYLTGHEEPGAALLLVPQTDEAKAAKLPPETLFLPPRDKRRERWDGVRIGSADADAAVRTGVAVVQPVAELRRALERAAAVFPKLYALFPAPGAEVDSAHAARWLRWLREQVPLAEWQDVRETLSALRQVKSESEQELLHLAIEHSMEAHREAMRALRPGLHEYEIAALMEYAFKRAGCERPAYIPIVGSGFNSTVLHYNQNRRQMQAGELVVIDVGAECAGYAADITRTLPVSSKFSPRQREIYEIVLGAQNAAIAAVKPGMSFARTGANSLYRIAYDYINTHGKDRKGEPLGQYFIHGLGHHIGLQVHDAGNPTRVLAPGMIVTIEPGIYIPEENLGVRLEDIVLVTEDGAVLLTASLPRTIEEIVRAMAEASTVEQ